MKKIVLLLMALLLSSKGFTNENPKNNFYDKNTGKYVTYYKNGAVQEIGTWIDNKNINELFFYYENGNLKHHFNFLENGKRDGLQIYYHENGQVSIEVNIRNGVEDGLCKRYSEFGQLISVFIFDKGKVVTQNGRFSFQEIPNGDGLEIDSNLSVNDSQEFDKNGQNVLYDESGKIALNGKFRNGKMIQGYKYIYNENGILDKIENYKNGRFIGYCQLTKEKI